MNTRTLAPEALARTDDVPNRVDAWEAVEDYQRYLDVAAQNPDSGSGALSSKLELPRGRIRSWEARSRPRRRARRRTRLVRWPHDRRVLGAEPARRVDLQRRVDQRTGSLAVFRAGPGRRRRASDRRAGPAGARLATRARPRVNYRPRENIYFCNGSGRPATRGARPF